MNEPSFIVEKYIHGVLFKGKFSAKTLSQLMGFFEKQYDYNLIAPDIAEKLQCFMCISSQLWVEDWRKELGLPYNPKKIMSAP